MIECLLLIVSVVIIRNIICVIIIDIVGVVVDGIASVVIVSFRSK